MLRTYSIQDGIEENTNKHRPKSSMIISEVDPEIKEDVQELCGGHRCWGEGSEEGPHKDVPDSTPAECPSLSLGAKEQSARPATAHRALIAVRRQSHSNQPSLTTRINCRLY